MTARFLSDIELLATVLQGGGVAKSDAYSIASELLALAGSIHGFMSWSSDDYRRVKGIGEARSAALAAAVELARRLTAVECCAPPVMDSASVIFQHFAPIVTGLEVEKFWVVCLNRRNRLMRTVEISSGSATSTLAHPREVFRAAIREGATAIACAHNHPSGDPAPSAPDMHVTRLLREASRTVDVQLVDHVIVGRRNLDPQGRGYFSFREAGLL